MTILKKISLARSVPPANDFNKRIRINKNGHIRKQLRLSFNFSLLKLVFLPAGDISKKPPWFRLLFWNNFNFLFYIIFNISNSIERKFALYYFTLGITVIKLNDLNKVSFVLREIGVKVFESWKFADGYPRHRGLDGFIRRGFIGVGIDIASHSVLSWRVRDLEKMISERPFPNCLPQ